MLPTNPLSAREIRAVAREYAVFLAHLIDNVPCGHNLSYDAAVAATARLLVGHGPIFCEIVCIGTGLSHEEVQAKPWPEVVSLGCQIIEATREAWRPAWPNGFLQAIIRDELRPHSTFIRRQA